MGDPEPVLQPSPQPQRLRKLPSWVINQLALRAARLTADLLGHTSVRSDFAVLAGLEEFGSVSQADLGRRLGMDRSDVVAILNRLQNDGLVQRSTDALDRRRNTVTLTAAGRRHLNELEVQLGAVQNALLKPLSAGEQQQLTSLLLRTLDAERDCPGPN
ncbi:winged helix-turn-helix transcriptional regulator [Blastococcus sp. MG754426]|uniref:MarR family winged helix-turn-helix transcriptional regulator n=1 Tax=unclassified Blastococcus TaxID=2619396 RepID=UPI001EF0EB94|nr:MULTISPECIES: MarR family winged helix-turn-helix transcriptional regulator [unclassified Blastococcus]MCF6509348.1 winged helix-turn-helix transcriptional regulator [Blastococcus sp. MG754426]MCF6513894.1 winged helix-turn-helix transcriptional regulator [Blastococcus sp. MG754427]